MAVKKVVRIIVAAIALTIFGSIVGALTSGWLFRWVYDIAPADVWRPMEGPPGGMFYAGFSLMNLIFVIVYVVLRKGVPGKNLVVKGLIYGLCVFGVGQLSGMWSTHTFMTVAWQAIVFITVLQLICTPIEGIIAATIYGRD